MQLSICNLDNEFKTIKLLLGVIICMFQLMPSSYSKYLSLIYSYSSPY